MRKLFLMRGAPASGKSTWLRENGLSEYVIEPDAIRLMLRGPVMGPDGKLHISQRDNKRVWAMVRELVEQRMETGQLTVIDGTFAKAADMRAYKSLASTHRYRVYVIDFTGVDKQAALERNAARMPEYKRVPDHVIERFYATFPNQEVPASYQVVTPDEALDVIGGIEPLDMTGYAAANVIGDVHGCATALFELLDGLGCERGDDGMPRLRDDELYVFLGDYTDRGIENARVLEFLFGAYARDNVIALEGNHERWLWKWCHGEHVHSDEFRDKTAPELEAAGTPRKEASRFYRSCRPFAYLEVADASAPSGSSLLFACHGGVPCIPRPFATASVDLLVRGAGGYPDVEECDAAWEEDEAPAYLCHGHRGHRSGDCHPSAHVFSLESGVERGGELSCARFEAEPRPGYDGPFLVQVANRVHDGAGGDVVPDDADLAGTIAAMRENPLIREKELGRFSSFNFTRDAFARQEWSAQTVKARGLFVDTAEPAVIARSYDKFFAVGEREETELGRLCGSLAFPVAAYVKENGFLGIASAVDGEEGPELFAASKSTDSGWFAGRFRELLEDALGDGMGAFLRELSERGASAVFEVIDHIDDRHIVEYAESGIVLLSLVANKLEFEELPYGELVRFARAHGLRVKRLAAVLDGPSELARWHAEVTAPGYSLDGELVEGFVISDARGAMSKVKTDWYRRWKATRKMIHEVARRGRSARAPELAGFGWEPAEADEFYSWLKGWLNAGDGEPDVIDVRRRWEERA